MSDIKSINEAFKKVLKETQIEEDAIEMIKAGTYEGEDIDKIVLENIDEFSVEDLTKIIENYDWYSHNGVAKLFPSGFHYAEFRGEKPIEKYPAKLAEAIANSKESENITDLFNIFYRQHNDLNTWGDAAQIWMKKVLEEPNSELFDNLGLGDDDIDYVADMLDTIGEYYPKFIMQVLRKLPEVRAEELIELIND